ncbi:hypothetical protein LCGC14_2008080 [marine sediment metagenome]|uniref:Uncharacterized protein n=1 Tax=marine sediment metagenome TaxID=412755 RepID=A0A0F9HY70_9ZZZZ
MELKDLFEGGYQKFSHSLTRGYYWRYILTTNDKVVLTALMDSVILDRKFYENGILVVNSRHDSLLIHKIGNMSYSTLKRSIDHLHDIGIIVKLRKKFRNNRYFLGFRHKNSQDRVYLLYHLCVKFENQVSEDIENQISKIEEEKIVLKKKNKNLYTTPKVDGINAYCLKADYKQFIKDHVDNINEFLYKRISEEGTLFYTLFGCEDVYRKPLTSRNIIYHSSI